MPLRIVLVHGAATTSAVWARVIPALRALGFDDVDAVDRPCTGDLARELAFLAPRVEGALVAGQSGGATLGLALAASGIPLAGAVCHEPAVGSLVPSLLAPVAAAYDRDGLAGFGAALYGPSWTVAAAGADRDAVARDLPMFRAFEPAASRQPEGAVLVTVGASSPPIRHEAAVALHDRLGYPIAQIDGRHFVAWDAAEAFAGTIAAHAARLPG